MVILPISLIFTIIQKQLVVMLVATTITFGYSGSALSMMVDSTPSGFYNTLTVIVDGWKKELLTISVYSILTFFYTAIIILIIAYNISNFLGIKELNFLLLDMLKYFYIASYLLQSTISLFLLLYLLEILVYAIRTLYRQMRDLRYAISDRDYSLNNPARTEQLNRTTAQITRENRILLEIQRPANTRPIYNAAPAA